MFTGIIEEKGKIANITKGKVQRIDIESTLKNKQGDSIAIDGICLDRVNLERALTISSRLGGHILLGHVDETARVIRKKGNEYFFQISRKNQKYLIEKGSISINGCSLTIMSISNDIFSVSVIPYTLQNTTLGNLKIGSLVNLEYDYLIKILTPCT
jgi:riboflavin synthase